jgi:rare lipoprotein A
MKLCLKKTCSLLVVLLAVVGCEAPKTHVGKVARSSRPYYCKGRRYRPQRFYEYDRVGLASWYGGKFHGRSKAFGETFNQYEFTAAHKTLPIPTVVRVTNLRNSKSAIVIVDDRGPYCSGRIIDLSYAAAEFLDLHRYRPSPVRVQSLAKESLRLSNYVGDHKSELKNNRLAYVYKNSVAKVKYRAKARGNVIKKAKKNNSIVGYLDKYP